MGGLPRGLSEHYRQQGLTWRRVSDPDKVVVVDRGQRLHTFSPESTPVVGAMAVAASARGWASMEVSGSESFRRAAYVEATARGVSVSGYEPTSADRVAASRGADLIASLRNPRVQAYLVASTAADRSSANATYPGLDKAFAAEDAARRVINAKASSAPEAVATFMSRFRENAAIAIHKRRELPQVEATTRSSEVRR
jgi:hypothetical protein